METTELTKVQLSDLIKAVNYMNDKNWDKYNEYGNVSAERICEKDGKKRRADLLRILHGIKSEL